MDAESLAKWLIDRGYAETKAGYGHATGEEIAEALLEVFDVVPKVA